MLTLSVVPPRQLRGRDISSFDDSECDISFQFLQDDLQKIVALFRCPALVKLAKGPSLPNEEVFLRGLYELVSREFFLKCANVLKVWSRCIYEAL